MILPSYPFTGIIQAFGGLLSRRELARVSPLPTLLVRLRVAGEEGRTCSGRPPPSTLRSIEGGFGEGKPARDASFLPDARTHSSVTAA